MRGTLRKSVMAATALLIVAGTTVAVPNSASARWGGGWHGGGWHGGWRGGGWGWGGVGLGIGTGLLLAAAVSAPYYGQFQQRLAGTESRGPRSPGIGGITRRLK